MKASILAAGLLILLAASCGIRPHDPALDELPPPETTARQADPERGKAVAERWCFACHVVTAGAAPLPDQVKAPTFAALAIDKDPEAVKQFIDGVHPPMPTYRLFPEEKQDLLAYIASLRPTR